MMQAWRKVFNECSVSLLAGETVAMMMVRAEGSENVAFSAWVSLLRRYWKDCTWPMARARMQSLSAISEALMLPVSLRRSFP